MYRRKLEDLNLLDDFLFVKMLENKEMGEEFGRCLLKIIFDREFGKLKVVSQKVYYGADTDKHGVRLDVYLEEEVDNETLLENAVICDIEPESEEKEKYKGQLPRRTRFYHAKIDANTLEAGMDYQNLKKVIVVMIMPFDPFGYDQMIYTIKNTCLEVPELPYDDGAKTMFLYTRGTQGNLSEGLRNLLCYMENTTEENVKNVDLKKIHNMVTIVKQKREVSREYMKLNEIKNMWQDFGREEGRQEGRQEGEIIGFIKTCRDFKVSAEEIQAKLVEKYNLSEGQARELCEKVV